MTIQRTVLLAAAGLLAATASETNAQCSRSLRYGIPSYGYRSIHVTPYVAHRPIVPVVPNPTHWAYQPLPHVTFGGCSHVDVLAHRLEIVMNELCLDLYYNYSHNPGFATTYAEAYELFQLARSIHVANHNLDRAAMQTQLAGTDHLFHHVQDDVRGWTRNPQRQIGTLGIMTKIEMAEETLHHLMEDVGVRVGPVLETPPAPGLLPGNGPAPLNLGTAPLGATPSPLNVSPAPFGSAPEPPVLPIP